MHHDFEDGTLQGWVPRGSAVLAVTNEAAATGLNSLKTTGRTAPWNGPGLNVMPTVQKDLLYQIRVSVRLTAGQAALQDTLRMTIERRVAGETSDRFDSIAASATNGVTSGSWVTLQGSYRLTTDVTKLILYVESVGATTTAATASFYIDDLALSYAPPLPVQTDIPSLKDVLADSFTIGGAVDVGEIASSRHTDLTRKHFDTITARHSWKFGPIHPTEATYNFGAADTIANFARQNGLRVRGHTLVWHQQNPDWLFRDAGGVDLTSACPWSTARSRSAVSGTSPGGPPAARPSAARTRSPRASRRCGTSIISTWSSA